MTTHILALEKDLFFSVKIRDTLRHHGIEVKTVRTLQAFELGLAVAGDEKPMLAIVNTAQVVANSKFTSDMPGLVKRMLNAQQDHARDDSPTG